MNVSSSHLHDIYCEEIKKVALSADDDKRATLNNKNYFCDACCEPDARVDATFDAILDAIAYIIAVIMSSF
jgi:hypothetical protein